MNAITPSRIREVALPSSHNAANLQKHKSLVLDTMKTLGDHVEDFFRHKRYGRIEIALEVSEGLVTEQDSHVRERKRDA